ncbi:MAG: epoxyqueuosine reductase QueH [Deltaproteobacteria bacterium]|nr:epoxyqueuosine reductase QueH [Deltaproteobacteria bacterium]
MKLLIHICCAPCVVYPLDVLRNEGHDVCGLFYNPNIHPYLEYKKRYDTLKDYAEQEGLKMIWAKGYPVEDFLRNVAFREEERCIQCYYDRLNYTAHIAKRGKFDAFITTLLYSKHQNHEMIVAIGHSTAKKNGVKFYDQDFREGWSEGIRRSKERGLYRQQYCGCIYSEKARYYRQKTLLSRERTGRNH